MVDHNETYGRHVCRTPSRTCCGYVLAIVEEHDAVTIMGDDIAGVLVRHDERRHHLDVMFTPKEKANSSSGGTPRGEL